MKLTYDRSAMGRPIVETELDDALKRILIEEFGVLFELQLAELLLTLSEPKALRRLGAKRAMLTEMKGLQPSIERASRELEAPLFALPPVGIRPADESDKAILSERKRLKADLKKAANLIRETERDVPMRCFNIPEQVGSRLPIRSQGKLGSCVGFGSTNSRNVTLPETELSHLFTYMLAKYFEGGDPWKQGSRQRYAFQGLVEVGSLRRSALPETDHPESMDPEPFFDQADHEIQGYVDCMLEEDDLDLMPELLMRILSGRFSRDLGPQAVALSLAVFPCWTLPSVTETGIIPAPRSGEERIGGHALSLVGYVKAGCSENPFGITLWLLKNSWGAKWAPMNPFGFPGYALIPTAYLTQSRLLWEAYLPIAEPSPIRPGRASSLLDILKRGWDRASITPDPVVLS